MGFVLENCMMNNNRYSSAKSGLQQKELRFWCGNLIRFCYPKIDFLCLFTCIWAFLFSFFRELVVVLVCWLSLLNCFWYPEYWVCNILLQSNQSQSTFYEGIYSLGSILQIFLTQMWLLYGDFVENEIIWYSRQFCFLLHI